jgi:uncharacterized protein (UPF0332 family)
VSPESIDYIGTAGLILSEAETFLEEGHNAVAAREAYLAVLSAARAIIFEKTGDAPKTHSGTRAMLAKLIHEGLPLDGKLLKFLADGFEQKIDADYGPRTPLGDPEAKAALEAARDFVAAARRILSR